MGRKRRKRMSFRVTLLPPEGATIKDVKEFIDDAVGTWAGQCRPPRFYNESDPGDPMANFDNATLRVSHIVKRKVKRDA